MFPVKSSRIPATANRIIFEHIKQSMLNKRCNDESKKNSATFERKQNVLRMRKPVVQTSCNFH